eukprot:423010-Amphidinium_carterae.1
MRYQSANCVNVSANYALTECQLRQCECRLHGISDSANYFALNADCAALECHSSFASPFLFQGCP